MWKKIGIGVGVLVVLIAAAMIYLNHRNRTLSPAGEAAFSANGVTAEVTYSRPSVRDRVIFGPESSGALQPYGKYWRLGANESTEITLKQDVYFNGEPLDAGTYKLYAIPGEKEFEIGVNKELGTWGAMEPDYDQDVLRTKVPVFLQEEITEQHTLRFEDAPEGIVLICEFEHVRFGVIMTAR